MADSNVNIIQDPNDPNNQKASGAAPTDPSAAPVGAAGSPQAPSGATGTSSGSGASGASVAGGGAKTGTGFVNLQTVLNANKQGGQALGQAIGSGITQASTDVGQGLGQAQSTFGQAAAAGTVGSQADIDNRNAILNSISGYTAPNVDPTTGASAPSTVSATPGRTADVTTTGAGPGTTSGSTPVTTPAPVSTAPPAPTTTGPTFGTTTTPLAGGLTAQNIADFGKYTAGQYTGPQGLDQATADQLQQQAVAAQQLGQNVGSAGGQQALLQQFIGQGQKQYGTGAQGLDQLLLGQQGMSPLQQARQSTVGLQGNVLGAEQAAQDQAAYNTNLSSQFGTDTNNAIANTLSPIQAAIAQSQANATAADTATMNQGTADQSLFSAPGGVVGDASTAGSGGISALAQQGLITPAQATQLQTLISKGYIDPTSAANSVYENANKNLTGNSTITNPNATYYTNQQAINQGLIPQNDAESTVDANGNYVMNPYAAAEGNLTGQSTFIDPTTQYLTNQQALTQGTGAYAPQYSSLASTGFDFGGALGKDFQSNAAQNNTAAAFINPTQAAQMNALAQLGGQQYNPLTQNLPTYTAANNTFNASDLMNQLETATHGAQLFNGGLVQPETSRIYKLLKRTK